METIAISFKNRQSSFKNSVCVAGNGITDKITETNFERKELAAALAFLRPGDVLVVWKLDRLGRSLKHLIETVTKLQERNVGFISLTESIDTTPPEGKLIFHIMRALAGSHATREKQRT